VLPLLTPQALKPCVKKQLGRSARTGLLGRTLADSQLHRQNQRPQNSHKILTNLRPIPNFFFEQPLKPVS
jgi:hypothetical protein